MDAQERAADLRVPVLGAVAWLAAVAALRAPGWSLLVVAGLAVALVWWRRRAGREVLTLVVWLMAASVVALLTVLRTATVQHSDVAVLARDHAVVDARVVLTSDPVARTGRFSTYVVVRARTVSVVARAARRRIRVPVLVLADSRWRRLRLGTTVRVVARSQPARTDDLAAVLSPRGPPQVLARPGALLAGAGSLRTSIREASAAHGGPASTLVPALVDGDDAGMPAELTEAFRVVGLTHLLAVSGTNLTLVVGCLLLLARWVGVRARGLTVVGILGVACFVLLARAEPSVLRAAAMGAVALLGLGDRGRRRGTHALGVTVLALMLLDPWLGVSAGFALSALATAGILWLAPGWRDRMVRWMPRWVAEAVAVPLAAQLACTPLVAALSGQVSMVAVLANLAAAPAVAPATVLGLAGGVAGLAWAPLGPVLTWPAVVAARWIIAVAVHLAQLPTAAVGWSTGAIGLALLTLLCLVIAMTAGAVLRHRIPSLVLGAVLVLVLLVPMPSPGWPPRGWVMVMCDVGQGDGLVLDAGAHRAVVVDTGPDPRLMDSCLRTLGIRDVPVLVLTHFHADHVDGLPGVLRGRRVRSIEVTSLEQPAAGVRLVERAAGAAHVPIRVATYAETGHVGPLSWQVLGPSRPPAADSDSPPNDDSLVLLVRTHGLRLLLMGDEETSSQEQLWRATSGTLRADVLKVAHHGSAKQDPQLVHALGARLGLISVGLHNDYGHPAPSLLALLRDCRMAVRRTDRDGDIAVVADDGLRVATGP